jgi:hypothetical protein
MSAKFIPQQYVAGFYAYAAMRADSILCINRKVEQDLLYLNTVSHYGTWSGAEFQPNGYVFSDGAFQHFHE